MSDPPAVDQSHVPAVDFNLGSRGQLEGATLEMIRRESLEDILGL
jgi:hypothetical protein